MIIARRGLKVNLKVRVMGQANAVAPTSIKSSLSLAYLLNFRCSVIKADAKILVYAYWPRPRSSGPGLEVKI